MTPTVGLYAGATFLSTIAGGFFALRFSGWMDRIMAFSGGLLLSAGLLDLLPEAIRLSAFSGPGPGIASAVASPLFCSVIGFLIFYLFERLAILRSYHSHHHHPESTAASLSGSQASPAPGHSHFHAPESPHADDRSPEARQQIGIMGAAGLCIHSLLDGFSIAVAFRANHAVGILVAVAVIGHDFSDGVTTVILVLAPGSSRKISLSWLLLDALAPLLGAALASAITLPPEQLGNLLGVFAGMFLYLGATHLLPEAHAISDSLSTVGWMVAGVAIMMLVTRWMG